MKPLISIKLCVLLREEVNGVKERSSKSIICSKWSLYQNENY